MFTDHRPTIIQYKTSDEHRGRDSPHESAECIDVQRDLGDKYARTGGTKREVTQPIVEENLVQNINAIVNTSVPAVYKTENPILVNEPRKEYKVLDQQATQLRCATN